MFIKSWASFPFELRLDGVDEELSHLPCMNMPSVMDVAVVFAPRPGKLAMLYLAKRAAPAALRRRRDGARVLARQHHLRRLGRVPPANVRCSCPLM
jgi:hypothetical protein